MADEYSSLADEAEGTPSFADAGDAVSQAEEAIEEAVESGDASPEEIAQLRKDLALAKRQAASFKGRAETANKALSERDAKQSELEKQVEALTAWQQQQQTRSQQAQAHSQDQQFENALANYARELEEEGTPQRAIQRVIAAERLAYQTNKDRTELQQMREQFRQQYGADIQSAKALSYAERLAAQTVAAAKKRGVDIDVSPVEILAKTKELLGRPPRDEREMEDVRAEMLMDKLLSSTKATKAAARRQNLQADAESGDFEQESSGATSLSEDQLQLQWERTGDPRLFKQINALRKKQGLSFVDDD